MDTINVFDQYMDFWEEHDVSAIPDELLYRIDELKNFMIIEDDTSDMCRTKTEFINIVNRSKTIIGVSCVFDDSLPVLCINAIKNNIPITIVVTNQIYDILKTKFCGQIKEFFNNSDCALYVTEDNIKVSHVVTDDCLYFSLCNKNGKFDINSNIVSNDPTSIKWGRDLFEYYRGRSLKIN
jgi:predicted transcriptional regulator